MTGRWNESEAGKGMFIAVLPIKEGAEIMLESAATIPVESNVRNSWRIHRRLTRGWVKGTRCLQRPVPLCRTLRQRSEGSLTAGACLMWARKTYANNEQNTDNKTERQAGSSVEGFPPPLLPDEQRHTEHHEKLWCA